MIAALLPNQSTLLIFASCFYHVASFMVGSFLLLLQGNGAESPVLKLKKADKKPVLTTRMLLPYYKLEAVSPQLFYDAFYPFLSYFRSAWLCSALY
jgi:hypothetical protein